MNNKFKCVRRFSLIAGLAVALIGSVVFARQQSDGSSLTGNWAVRGNSNDGYVRVSYFNLKHDAGKITGTIRVTQFFYTSKESSGGPDGFTIVGSMMDERANGASPTKENFKANS